MIYIKCREIVLELLAKFFEIANINVICNLVSLIGVHL